MAETEVIQQQMEETRARLADNLDKLSQQTVETVENVAEAVTETVGSVQETAAAVSETVQAVTETTEETVEGLKEMLNIPRQVERYPWLMFGGSVVLGYVAGNMLPALPTDRGQATTTDNNRLSESPSAALGGMRPTQQPTESEGQEESWFSGILQTLRPALDKLKGLAIGATLGVARDAITQSLSGDLGHQLREVFDDMTSRLGGQPVNPVEMSSSSSPATERRTHEHGNATEMERPLGTGSR